MEEFFNLIKEERHKYNKFILKNKLFPTLKTKLMDFILYTPNDKNLFIQSFNKLISNKAFEVFIIKLEEKLSLKKEFNLYLNRNLATDDIHIIKKSIVLNENMIFLYKDGKQVTNLYNRLRNGIAHGNFYILNRRFVIWNFTKKSNISFFMNIKLSDFDYLHKSLITAIVNE
jgi:hypothetical protein